MSDYPAGAEFDSNAPYNQEIDVFACLECDKQIDLYGYCSECQEYVDRENAKKKPIEMLHHLAYLSKDIDNMYFFNKLNEVIEQIKQL